MRIPANELIGGAANTVKLTPEEIEQAKAERKSKSPDRGVKGLAEKGKEFLGLGKKSQA